MINIILKVLIVYMIVRIITTFISLKKQNKHIMELREKYYEMTKEEALTLTDAELIQAASFRVSTRYSKLHGGLGVLNEKEKTLLTYDQMKMCCTTPKASINTFFADYTSLIIYANEVFDILGAGKDSYAGAHDLYLKFEAEAQKDIDEVIDELDQVSEEKTFVDYTNELKPVFSSAESQEKIASYIKENIDEFFFEINDDDDEYDDDEITEFYDESEED